MVKWLRELYEANTPRGIRFRYGLLIVDVAVILFLVVSSFFPGAFVTERFDAVFGVVILTDFVARMLISRSPLLELTHLAGMADILVVMSLLAPVIGENLAFLRVARTFRLLRSYQMVTRLQRDFPYFRRHQDVLFAALNLGMFIFVMTAIVYETQVRTNPAITNYADALYFTVTTLTTTGFGDITLPGTWGRLLSVAIMIFGVSLFIRLIQLLFRPQKLHVACRNCGLSRHDPDAIHCKHCGKIVRIPHEGRE
ncbi:MAG TPA: potassium channel family protein [Nitrospiraceae bacterium]|nr:potassium channel family protein [Nitrospiraceae bacterium]